MRALRHSKGRAATAAAAALLATAADVGADKLSSSDCGGGLMTLHVLHR